MVKPFKILLYAIALFSLISLSCQAVLNQTSEPTSTASYVLQPTNDSSNSPAPTEIESGNTLPETSQASGELLFADDFSNPNSGWDESTDEFGSTVYSEDKYKISISTDNYYYWSSPGVAYDDVIIEVEARLESGSSQNDIGIICRLQDNDNFYFLTISSDGYYQIAKYVNSEEQFVGMDQYGFDSDAIKEDEMNLVRAECVGNELALFANNIELARVTDTDFQGGDVGLIAGTYDIPEMSVTFDNFRVTAP
jgi:hypothetical protein